MPFQSRSQARGAFSGAFGPKMQADAKEWADATPGGVGSLPDRLPAVPSPHAKPKKVRTAREKMLDSLTSTHGPARPRR